MTEPTRYLAGRGTTVELAGETFNVSVHLALLGGRVSCVGLEVKSFDEQREPTGLITIDPGDGFAELTTPRLRSLRLGELVDEAIAYWSALLDEAADYPGVRWTSQQLAELKEDRAALERQSERPRRPGRPATLSHPDVVTMVAETYQRHVAQGGRKPVQAVLDAMRRDEVVPGTGSDGQITIDQARAAIRRARAKNLLPKGKP